MKKQYIQYGPRERIAKGGVASLGDSELIAALLGTGTSSTPVLSLAKLVLEFLGGLDGLARASIHQLQSLPGLGPSKAAQLVAAVELGQRTLTQPLMRGKALNCSKDVDRAFRSRLAHKEIEHFFSIPLDAKNRPMGEIHVASGTISGCVIEVSVVFRELLRWAASRVIFIHNHPSGVPTPSSEDISLTKQLVKAGELLGISVLDHIIIGYEGFFSFLDNDLIQLELHQIDDKNK